MGTGINPVEETIHTVQRRGLETASLSVRK